MAPKNTTRRVATLLSHVSPAAAEATVVTEPSVVEPDDSSYEGSVAALALQDSLPVVLLDALLPRQRIQLAVEDDVHKRMVCGCLEAAASGAAPCFGVVGRDPLSEQPLSFGVEVEIVRSALANGVMRLELVGRRCFSIEDSTTVDGYSVASVGWAYTAEPDKDAVEVEEEPQDERAALQSAVKQLYALTDEWLGLVMATDREQGVLRSGLGFKRQAADVFGRQGNPRAGEPGQNVGDVLERIHALTDQVLRSSLLRLGRLLRRHRGGRRGRNGGGGSGDRASASGVS